MRDLTLFIDEAKQKIPNNIRKFIIALKDWALNNGFSEGEDWYQKGWPKAHTILVKEKSIQFLYSDGRYLKIAAIPGTRQRGNSVYARIDSISKDGYSMAEEYRIDLMDGQAWDFLDKVKFKHGGIGFDPAKLQAPQIMYLLNAITTIADDKCIDRIFNKFYKMSDKGYKIKGRASHEIQFSDIVDTEGKVYKYNMKFGEFFEKSLGIKDWATWEDDKIDLEWIMAYYENKIPKDNIKETFKSLANEDAYIELYKGHRGYDHIEMRIDVDKYNFYGEFTNWENAEEYETLAYRKMAKFIETNK